MEDIEKLKKIAKLSQELKRHGFASLTDEAVRQSEEIYKEKLPQYDAPKPTNTGGKPMDSEELRTVQTRLAAVESTVETLLGKMNEMIKAINDLEQAMKSRIQSQRENPQQKFTDSGISQEPSRPVEARPDKGSETNQRSGNFSPSDVQIDKIFYSGSGAKKR